MTYNQQISDVLAHAYVWNDKNSGAFKFKSQDSNYRLWKPDTNFTPDNGVRFHAKVDHIRGGHKDDHAVVEMIFDDSGKLVGGEANFEIQGEDNIVAPFAEAIKGASSLDPRAEVAAVLLHVAGNVHSQIVKLSDQGGRLNFPDVVEGLMDSLAYLVLQQVDIERNYLAFATSQDTPQHGQKNRSSENFQVAQDCTVSVDIIGSNQYGWNHADNLKFSIMEDKKGKKDRHVKQDLNQGSNGIELKRGKNYYISNPYYTNAVDPGQTSFVVGFYN